VAVVVAALGSALVLVVTSVTWLLGWGSVGLTGVLAGVVLGVGGGVVLAATGAGLVTVLAALTRRGGCATTLTDAEEVLGLTGCWDWRTITGWLASWLTGTLAVRAACG